MLQYYFSLSQFGLIKSSFFEHSTTCNMPNVHSRLDSILELCGTFGTAVVITGPNGDPRDRLFQSHPHIDNMIYIFLLYYSM